MTLCGSTQPLNLSKYSHGSDIRRLEHVKDASGPNVLYCKYSLECVEERLTTVQKELTHTILLHPSYFGPRMLQFLESKLYADVEGTCSGQYGYIIAVVSILDIGRGMVLSGTGQAEFVTRYRAIVFKPFKGEVVDGVVNNVNKVHLLTRFCCMFTTWT